MIKRISSDKLPKEIGSYSMASLVGNIIFTSGQLPIDSKTGKLVLQDICAQTRKCLENIRHILEANNSNIDRIVKVTVFLKRIDDFKKFDAEYKTFFNNSNYPSRTTVEVGNLPMGALIEIEAIAIAK